jgi:hypothetical protein
VSHAVASLAHGRRSLQAAALLALVLRAGSLRALTSLDLSANRLGTLGLAAAPGSLRKSTGGLDERGGPAGGARRGTSSGMCGMCGMSTVSAAQGRGVTRTTL